MSTTTIRLPPDLKARVVAAAKRAGTTPHSFIVEAIAEKADEAERRGDFHAVAEKRYSQIAASGKTMPWMKCARTWSIASRAKRHAGRWRRSRAVRMSRVEMAPEVTDDFDRILDHLAQHDAETPGADPRNHSGLRCAGDQSADWSASARPQARTDHRATRARLVRYTATYRKWIRSSPCRAKPARSWVSATLTSKNMGPRLRGDDSSASSLHAPACAR